MAHEPRRPEAQDARAGRPASGTQSPTPVQLAEESRRRLRAQGDRSVAAGQRAYFKDADQIEFYGLKAPALRALDRELFERVRSSWSLADAVAYCGAMLAQPQLEAKGLGVMLLARYRKSFDARLLVAGKSWLASGLCANWATTDCLCSLVITQVLRRHPDRIAVLASWTRSRSLWVRRAAAVSLVGLARRGQALDTAYCVASALLGDREDLIHKATGWLLREAGKTDAARLEAFLLEHGPRVPRTALRYAIERLPAPRREQLLQATRGSVTRCAARSPDRRATRGARAGRPP